MLASLDAFLQPHKAILNLVNSRIESVITSVEECISRVATDPSQDYHSSMLNEAVGELVAIIQRAKDSGSGPETVGLLQKQLNLNFQNF